MANPHHLTTAIATHNEVLRKRCAKLEEDKNGLWKLIYEIRDAVFPKGFSGGKTQGEILGQAKRVAQHSFEMSDPNGPFWKAQSELTILRKEIKRLQKANSER
jgi:hypothetical protein